MEGSPNTKEQTCSNGTAESYELDVTGFQTGRVHQSRHQRTKVQHNTAWKRHLPPGDVTIFFGGLDVAVHIGSFTHPDPLRLDDARGILVRRSIVTISPLWLDVVRSLVHVE